jgi:hypothetical protein
MLGWAHGKEAALAPPHPTLRFTTCTCSAATGKSTVERLTFRAVTRTLSFDQTWPVQHKGNGAVAER